MRTILIALAAAATVALSGPQILEAQGPPAHARGQQKAEKQDRGQGQGQAKGQAKAKGQGQGQGQARGQGQPGARGAARGGPPPHAAARRGGPAPDVDRFNRNLLQKAVRSRSQKKADARGVQVRREGGQVRVVDDRGQLLFALPSETADRLGYWRAAVVPRFREDSYRDRGDDGGIFGEGGIFGDRRADYPDRGEGGSPAFCRSGEGHPVWGRDWCLDKGFGLGDGRSAWGVDRDLEDIVLRRPDPRREVLDRGGLIDVLGDIVFGRLAVQSLVLGADEPLSGRWLPTRDGPRILRVQAGDLPVAELVDYDGNDSVDTILFNLGG